MEGKAVFFPRLNRVGSKSKRDEKRRPGKVGDEAFSFVLPSSQGKLVDYYKDYYGKFHLVMTFFPAAFTPV